MCALAATGTRAQANGAAGATAEEERQVLRVDREWTNAEVAHDAARLRDILTDGFVATVGAGKPYDKERFIAFVATGEIDPTLSHDFSDQTVRIDGDTAVLLETDTIRRNRNGVATTRVYRFTVTYVRREGEWRALALHGVQASDSRQ